MNRGAVTSPQELIQGKVPGLFVAPSDGSPGAGSTIRIRGGTSLNASNDPLIVIDGIPISNDAAPSTPNALATINPNDIETFTVLKIPQSVYQLARHYLPARFEHRPKHCYRR
ncbi:TonB-dependent receptor plug domain-containing protein [Bacteroides sp.]|uniref:TonB-dependent receptor plug domain-containing protein n=1 Tax=Bacteroides sp. TaxID=29523 RepID=UPI00260A85E3|nr:TonB-dependent receptor plug domain-containing protein [Bacteroides sp.]MDD3038507.1 TonB-dependent receptor plug domain-containing protein [Bacteroides sp.]